MEAPANTLTPRQLYKFMTGAVVPRPIAWVSTRSAAGSANLAPFSYFNAVGNDPPTLMFSSGRRDGRAKDTIANVLETEAFVINIVPYALAEAMNLSAIDAPPEVDEFEIVGVTASAAAAVAAPRVAESPVHFECVLSGTHEIGANIVVFGRIVHLHLDDRVILPGERIDMAALDAVGRLAGSGYARLTDRFELTRPSYNDLVIGDPDGD
jgi:flavin reductase (DIM6/NTAB) family NADH-FMN oxidoreductase RutF